MKIDLFIKIFLALMLFTKTGFSTSILDISLENFLNICLYLPQREEQLHFTHTNKKFYNYSKFLFVNKVFYPKDKSISLKDFKVAFHGQNYFKKIKLSEFNFYPPFINVLNNSDNLVYLDLSNNYIETRVMKKLLLAIRNNKSITYLNLSNNRINNKQSNLISIIIKDNNKLELLNLDNNSIGYEGCSKLKKHMMYNTSLITLSLKYNFLTCKANKKIIQMLFFNNTIQHLFLNGSQFSIEEIVLLGKVMSKNSALHHLDIEGYITSDYRLKSKGTKILICGMMNFNNTLQILNLSRQDIGDEGAKILGNYLKTNPQLTYLDLSRNLMNKVGIEDLIISLNTNENLKYLNIKENIYKYNDDDISRNNIKNLINIKKNENLYIEEDLY